MNGHRSDEEHRRWCPECDAQRKRPGWMVVLVAGWLLGWLLVLVICAVAALYGWLT